MYMCKYCGTTFEEHISTCPNCAANDFWKYEEPNERQEKDSSLEESYENTPESSEEELQDHDTCDGTECHLIVEDYENLGFFDGLLDLPIGTFTHLAVLTMTLIISLYILSTTPRLMEDLLAKTEQKINKLFETVETEPHHSTIELDENGSATIEIDAGTWQGEVDFISDVLKRSE